jgi:hypothetical protein
MLFLDLTVPPHKSVTRGSAVQTADGERNSVSLRYIHLELTSLGNLRPCGLILYKFFSFFFLKRFIAQEISDIHLVTRNYKNCSLNQFALVVARCASDRVYALLSCYWCSSEGKHCCSWVGG